MRYSAYAFILVIGLSVTHASQKVDRPSDLEDMQAMRKVRAQQLEREAEVRIREARNLLGTDPEQSRDILKELLVLVDRSDDLGDADKNRLLRELEIRFHETIVISSINHALTMHATEPEQARKALKRIRELVARDEHLDAETEQRLLRQLDLRIGGTAMPPQESSSDQSLSTERNVRLRKIERLCSEGRWEDAEGYALAVVATDKAALDHKKREPELKQFVASVVRLAEIQNTQSKWNEARAAMKRVEDMAALDYQGTQGKSLLEKDGIMAFIYEQRGIADLGLGDVGSAETYLEQAIDVADKDRSSPQALNPNHVGAGRILMHLSDAYAANERKAEAAQAIQRAIVIFAESLGEQHEETKRARGRLTKLKEVK